MSFIDSLIGFAPYAEGMVQRHDQRALADFAQQRQRMKDIQDEQTQYAREGLMHSQAGEADARTQSLLMPKIPPMLKTLNERGEVVYTPATAAAGLQAPVPAKPPEPIVAVQDPDAPNAPPKYVTRTNAVGKSPVAKPSAADPMVVTVDSKGNRVWTPRSKAAGLNAPAPVGPPPDRTLVPTENPDNPTGPAILTPRAQAAGLHVPTKPVAQGGGGQSLAPEDRQKMLNQAKIDNATMKAYENKVMQSGQAPGFAAGAAGIAASAAPTGIVGGIAGLIGNKATGAIDPDYQRYITAQRSYGRIMGNLQSKRYTDHQAEIERSISGLQGNDLNTTIQYKQQLRDASLAGDDTAPTAAPKSGAKSSGNIDLGASSGPAKPQSYEEWKKSKGITP